MDDLPDGYRRAADGVGMVLIDPEFCPAGHPFRFGQRASLAYCENREHKPHEAWWCVCGQKIFRFDGAFWGELECISSRA